MGQTTRTVILVTLWIVFGTLFLVPFAAFFETLFRIWTSDTEFSYGLLIPVIVAYLIFRRRAELSETACQPAPILSLNLILVGCALQVLASLNGTLLFSGLALAVSLIGISGYLWGRQSIRVVAVPMTFLVLMVPLPSFVMGLIAWKLQLKASSVSSALLDFLGVPVYQEGILLRLPNYALEVKQACSGLRSIFALLTLALIIGLVSEKKWTNRLLLVIVTPIFALAANVVRIVSTGLVVSRFGGLAIGETLHTILGISVFVGTVFSLLVFQKILRWANKSYA